MATEQEPMATPSADKIPMAAPITEEEFVFETVQFDPRFPNQNQTRHCYQSYVDFHRCQKLRGESYEPCQYFKKVFTTLCPNAWIAKWNDQLADGTFPTKF